jgi:phage shock protein C
MYKKLFRSRRNRMLFGVCGGLAEYFGIDATIIRILAIVIAFSGAGIFAYIIAAIVMPDEDTAYSSGEWKSEQHDYRTQYASKFSEDYESAGSEWETKPASDDRNRLLLGAVLIIAGLIFLLRLIMPWFDLKYLVPLLLIVIGGVIIYKGRK